MSLIERDAIEIVSRSERDTRRVGECIAAACRAESSDRAVVIAIAGELGAGKTRLVRGIAGGLGVDAAQISSPTFVVAVEHKGADAALVHVDAFRLRDAAELATIGWDELLARTPCVIAVEWPSKIAAALPQHRIDVTIEALGASERLIAVHDRRDDQSIAAMKAALAFFAPAVEPGGHRCPTCGQQSADAAFPFCSKRCRMADMNRWFSGGYRMTRPAEADEELSE